MKQCINEKQKTSSDRPYRPLTPLEKEGVMIAEFMGLRYETRNYFGGNYGTDENGFDTYSHNSIMVGTYYDGKKTTMLTSCMEYHTDWNWLMPVVHKCYQEHTCSQERMNSNDAYEIKTCDITRVYNAVLKFIKENGRELSYQEIISDLDKFDN